MPLKYEDGPDFCTVTFATGAAFALTVHPERMKLMEAALSASPVGELTPEQISIQNDMFAAWVGDPKFREAFRNDCKRLLNAASASPVAQEPVAQKYDDTLVPFVALMRAELHANSGKGDRPGWLQMDRNTGLLEIFYHLAKLQKAVKDNDPERIREFGADVANMSMMLVDICDALPTYTAPPAPALDARMREALPPTQEYLLRAMATNYAGGHCWDHLDGEACTKAADEIRDLRAALSSPVQSEKKNHDGQRTGGRFSEAV